MQFQHYENISTVDRCMASFLAAFSVFMISYSATRVYLNYSSQVDAQVESNVLPHAASLWSDLGNN
ncbi:hypothetical protein [Okeania sp.]|uniref:hypothetical protein n=1 Tax=Okeania sp. TaxID=3100323 RepID=UPI002B4B0B5E|nr:hypothetical protein [Okeania sp.]MEB3343126.1 hypothetical protein [Okeania sp.]